MVRQPVDASGRRIFGRIFGRSCAAPCASDHAPSRARFARRLGPQPLIDGAGRPVCLLSIAFTASLRLTSSGCTPAGYILGGPGSLRSRATPKHLRAPLISRCASHIEKSGNPGTSTALSSATPHSLASLREVFFGVAREQAPGAGCAPIRLPGAGAPSGALGLQRRTAPASPRRGLGGLRLDASPHCDKSQWTLLRDYPEGSAFRISLQRRNKLLLAFRLLFCSLAK